LKQSAAFVDRVDAPAADAIASGVVGGTEAAEFAAGGGNNLSAAGFLYRGVGFGRRPSAILRPVALTYPEI
jgi:hypothetical protein